MANPEIDEDLEFHRSEWKFQRAGRIVMFVFLAAAALGVFGSGIFSKHTAQNGVLRIKYERIGRLEKTSVFEIRLQGSQNWIGGSQRRVWISSQFLKDIRMERIEPEPSDVVADEFGQSYIFKTSGAGDPISVFFHFRPERPGLHRAYIRADQKAGELRLKQLVYP